MSFETWGWEHSRTGQDMPGQARHYMSWLACCLPISRPSDSLLMFKWTNHVKPCQFLPQPHPFSIKAPSFQASGSNPLSPAWDPVRSGALPLWLHHVVDTSVSCGRYMLARAPSLNYLMLLHQDGRLFVILGCMPNQELSGGFPTRFFHIYYITIVFPVQNSKETSNKSLSMHVYVK